MSSNFPPPRPNSAAPLAIPGFQALAASKEYAGQEQIGNISWKGGTLKHIEAEEAVIPVDLPEKLTQLVRHCWTSAEVSPNAQRSGAQIGFGSRAGHIPDRIQALQKSFNPADIFEAQRLKERTADYKPQVSAIRPTVDSVIRTNPHLGGVVPTDWKVTEQLQRVCAYTFRGDKRPPADVLAAGGFFPPITRTDRFYVDNVIFPQFAGYMKRRFNIEVSKTTFDRAYAQNVAFPQDRMVVANFFAWRSLLEADAYHVGRMLADETLKGYISTTRSTRVAKGFAGATGWVYITLVRGGFLVPDQGKHVWTSIFGEQEIAWPGSIPATDIFGFRQVSNGLFSGPLYMCQGFESKNPTAYEKCFKLLSGKPQVDE